MIVEVVAVGTELLLGQIVNGNGATIGAALAESGFDAHYQQVVGDNLGRMEQAFRIAIDRSDAVIVTGGIGPTQDDLTREGLSAVTGRPLVRDEGQVEVLRRRFEASGRQMPASNLRQADLPEGAERIPNPKGTAPGIALLHEGTWIFVVPGVPEEMAWLLHHEVLPRLRAVAGIEEAIVSRLLRTWGHSESRVAELLDDLYGSVNPSIAFLASSGEIKVRITAKARDDAAARALIVPVEAAVRERLGTSVFGVDDETIESVVLREVEERGWTLGTAESATGGLVAQRLTSVPGASRVFRGSVVAYATDLKASLLGVPEDTLDAGVVSEETAEAMAEGARRALGVDVAVAVTGSAGPDPQEREAGTMVLAVATPEGVRGRTLRLPGDRERVRTYASTAALQLIRLAVSGSWWRR
jgi:nicotinamide-nucleotide amidase